jgi:5-methylcytosine-specific restriction endonuclease McrA
MRSEAVKRAQRKYRKSEKGKAWFKAWRQRNAKKWCDYSRRGNAKQEALRRGVTIGDLVEIRKVYDRRAWWGQWFDVVVDHIIPFARGGTHEASNLQIIYRRENELKWTKSDYKPRVIFL